MIKINLVSNKKKHKRLKLCYLATCKL